MEPFDGNLSLLNRYDGALRDLLRDQYREIARRAGSETAADPERIAVLYGSLRDARRLGTEDFARFCLAFSGLYADEMKAGFADSDTEEADTARIATMENAFSRQALERFARRFRSAEILRCPGYREVAEEVYSGRATHGILPVANRTDGQLPTFRRLIVRYDLKITAAADILSDEETDMRFALLRRGIPNSETPPDCLDLTVVLTDEVTPGSFLSACETLGAVVEVVGTHPLSTEEDRSALDLCFDIRHADRAALAAFLEGSRARYEIIGAYPVIGNS